MEIILKRNKYYKSSFFLFVKNTKRRNVLKIGAIFYEASLDSHVFRVDFDLLFLLLLNGVKFGDSFFRSLSTLRGDLFFWIFLLVLFGKK